MAEISSDLIKQLRERTGAGLLDCKKALADNNSDLEKAATFLREKGLAKADKKSDRVTKEGRIISYVHSNHKIGVLLELNCETDFVAKNEDFEVLGKELCMQIAAASPTYLSPENVPADIIENEKKIIRAQLLQEGKAEAILDKIIPGKLNSYYAENCLLEQQYIKENKKLVKDFIKESIAKFGENITIGRFVRYQIGG